MIYAGKMDAECIPICDAINRIPRLRTVESCCGHSQEPFRVFIEATSFHALADLCYCVDWCHSGARGWRVIAYTDCSAAPNRFILEGPAGDFAGADQIAALISEQFPERKKVKSRGGRRRQKHVSGYNL